MSTFQNMSLKQLSLFASKMIYFIWFNTYTNDGICGRFTESNPVREFYKFVYKLIYGIQAPYSLVLLTILYVGRLKLRSPAVVQQDNSGGTEYRAFVCALVVANKYLDDKCFINSAWVEALNTTALDLTQFEFEFLKSINYDLYVSEIQYNEWIQTLEGIINAGDQYICFKISSPEFQYTVHQQISMLRKRTYKIAFGDQFGCGMFVSASKRAKLDDQEVVSREMFSRDHYARTIATATTTAQHNIATPENTTNATTQNTTNNNTTSTTNTSNTTHGNNNIAARNILLNTINTIKDYLKSMFRF